MEIEKIVLKFKMNEKGTQFIAYCEEYPQIKGIGPDQGHATANFWKAFNQVEMQNEHQSTLSKKVETVETPTGKTTGKKKKAA